MKPAFGISNILSLILGSLLFMCSHCIAMEEVDIPDSGFLSSNPRPFTSLSLGESLEKPPQAIRLLSLDATGTDVVVLLLQLAKMEQVSGKPLHEMFDVFGGVGMGGVAAALLTHKNKDGTVLSAAQVLKRFVHHFHTIYTPVCSFTSYIPLLSTLKLNEEELQAYWLSYLEDESFSPENFIKRTILVGCCLQEKCSRIEDTHHPDQDRQMSGVTESEINLTYSQACEVFLMSSTLPDFFPAQRLHPGFSFYELHVTDGSPVEPNPVNLITQRLLDEFADNDGKGAIPKINITSFGVRREKPYSEFTNPSEKNQILQSIKYAETERKMSSLLTPRKGIKYNRFEHIITEPAQHPFVDTSHESFIWLIEQGQMCLEKHPFRTYLEELGPIDLTQQQFIEDIKESLEKVDITDLNKATLRYHLRTYLNSQQAEPNPFFNSPLFSQLNYGRKDRVAIQTWLDQMIELVKQHNEQKSCLSHIISKFKGNILKWNPEDTGKHEKLLSQLEAERQKF